MTDAAIKALISQGVADALAEYEAHRSSGNDDDNHDSGSRRRTERALLVRENGIYIPHKQLHCHVPDQVCYIYSSWKCTNNLKVKGTDVVSYTQRFQELALMCGRMFLEEFDEVKKYVGGLPDLIQGSVMASKPKIMQDAIEFANDLMDQKICTFEERQAENKRKLDNENLAQQQAPKKKNVARDYSVRSGEKKEYAGTLSLGNKCKFYHNGPCIKYKNCKRVGYFIRDCRSLAAINN
nr:reverse transcriptase domain-containing protein [Tanacetum cinerariifolium]